MTNENQSFYQTIPLLFEQSAGLSSRGRRGVLLPKTGVEETPLPNELLRADLNIPELDEASVVRHFTRLSQQNFSVDGQFYPLGSCTMKYSPKMNEEAASQRGFRLSHPLSSDTCNQGSLELIYRLQEALKEITGFEACSLQYAAGAHGELAGLLMIRAWHLAHNNSQRKRVLIPDSAHGTNPATCGMAGYAAETIPSDENGAVDMAALKEAASGDKAETLAALMITNPGTLGLFEKNIVEINQIIHDAGGLVYGDGANMNALMGIVKPGELGFDVMHLNLHKTFSTPHGGGGPGAGAVMAGKTLGAYLPGPVTVQKGTPAYCLEQPASSIGRLKVFNGNFAVLVRAYAYIRAMGAAGLRQASEQAVLSANYLRFLIKEHYPTPYGADRPCMHEFTASPDLGNDIHTVDIAKRLIDYGFHPPTVYFPLIVKEAFMVEPTETESKETLEAFAGALTKIAEEAKTQPELLKNAPHVTPVGRLDDTAAARNPVLRFEGN
ncbi:MAG: aminomethyl-transferring glycine dehydrogenase subunit GcvPB [Treponema sp.]|jgi:glycine dehydrogenase subunit 2|nr:aminomethyl-transferring glycine dehydrogenase subunit GcvPB [Treponema sp.]